MLLFEFDPGALPALGPCFCVVGRQQHHREGCEDLREHSGSHFFTLMKIQFLPTPPYPPPPLVSGETPALVSILVRSSEPTPVTLRFLTMGVYINFGTRMRTVVDVRVNMHPTPWPVSRQGTGARCQIGTIQVVQSIVYQRKKPLADRMTYASAEKEAPGAHLGLSKMPCGYRLGCSDFGQCPLIRSLLVLTYVLCINSRLHTNYVLSIPKMGDRQRAYSALQLTAIFKICTWQRVQGHTAAKSMHQLSYWGKAVLPTGRNRKTMAPATKTGSGP